MKKNKIKKDMNLNFDAKVSVQEVENNLGIYFGEIPGNIEYIYLISSSVTITFIFKFSTILSSLKFSHN